MTLLSDQTILERLGFGPSHPFQLVIEPLTPGAIQPCSVDLHLGDELLVYEGPVMDTRADEARFWRAVDAQERDAGDGWVLKPGKLYLGATTERIRVPLDVCGQLAGISSRARQGVVIHQQAGLLDPGYDGWPTLELTVEAAPTRLYVGQRIGQVTFTLLDRPALHAYHGRYQRDRRPTPARLEPPAASHRGELPQHGRLALS